jgi:hypothetical protein
MGAVDLYSYGNGVNGLGLWSRTNAVLPTAVKYDSPTWGGFSFSALYSFNTSGQIGVSGVGYTNDFNTGLNGYYSGGIYNLGAGWNYGNYSIQLATIVWQQVGTYTTGTEGMNLPLSAYPQAAYSNAYASRLEFGYDDPDGAIAGVGIQVASGLGWTSWANSGGAFNNVYVNPGYVAGATNADRVANIPGLNNAEYQTQELAASFGWHIAEWTPKIGYVYGNNLMYNGNIGSVATGSANQIPNSGYQQLVAELDWNITPKTIAFLNYGQIWYGGLLSNVNYYGTPSPTNTPAEGSSVNGSNAYQNSQATVGVGFSHTF